MDFVTMLKSWVLQSLRQKIQIWLLIKSHENTSIFTDKLHENDTNLRRRYQQPDQSLSSAPSFQASNQAYKSQAILPPNKPYSIANVDFGIDQELPRKINKDYGPNGFYFKIPSSI